jgi:hypothetical protein
MGLIVKKPAAIASESGTYVGHNAFLYVSLLVQKSDAQVGAAYLSAGFFGQFLGSAGWHPHVSEGLAVAAACLMVVVGVVAAWCLRKSRTQPAVAPHAKELVSRLSARQPTVAASEWIDGLARLASFRGVEPRRNETVDKLMLRALGRQRWLAIAVDVPEDVRKATAK